jgi:hypothetical protein
MSEVAHGEGRSPIVLRQLTRLRLCNRLRQVIFPKRRKNLDGHGCLDYFSTVIYIPGDAPAVSRSGIESFCSDRQPNAALNQVAGLFIEMGMTGQDTAGFQSEFSKKRLFPVCQGLEFYSRDDLTVTIWVGFGKQLFSFLLLMHHVLREIERGLSLLPQANLFIGSLSIH